MKTSSHTPPFEDNLSFLKALLIFAENGGFFRPTILPIRGTFDAFQYNRLHKKKVGSSGLAQQLARILYLDSRKTYTRKLKEAGLAIYLVLRYGHSWILDTYIKRADFDLPERGFYAAAKFYFGKHLQELTTLEIITLVAILPNPAKNRPDIFPQDALAARNKLIFRLYRKQYLTADEATLVNVYNKPWPPLIEQKLRRILLQHYKLARKHRTSLSVFEPKNGFKEIYQKKKLQYNAKRIRLAREYALMHYGRELEKILPQAIIIHWTASNELNDAYYWFYPAEQKNFQNGTLNVSSHYLVDRDGTIYKLLPDNDLARHAVGYNWCAIGIENVGGLNGCENLTTAQLKANVTLIKYLRLKYTKIKYVFGHYQQEQARKVTGLHLDLIENNFFTKQDPGPKFMAALKAELSDYGVEFLD